MLYNRQLVLLEDYTTKKFKTAAVYCTCCGQSSVSDFLYYHQMAAKLGISKILQRGFNLAQDQVVINTLNKGSI